MTVRELYNYLDEKIPSSLSCEWDNDGLMCCPDGQREVLRVLVALDVTQEVVDEAVNGKYDVIVTHHPFIFKGLKAINDESFIAQRAMRLIAHGISVMSFHTRLDAVNGGVNDMLACALGLCDVKVFCHGDEMIGRIGRLPAPMKLEDFARLVKSALGSPAVLYADAGREVSCVAVLGGEGGDDIFAARAAGADTYVSGRLGYHNMTDAQGIGINLIEAGHFYTENPVCLVLKELVSSLDEKIECTVYFSGNIGAV